MSRDDNELTAEMARIAAPPRSWALRLLGPIAAICLFGMMALTFINVVARYFFNRPIAGGEEIQAFLLGFIIFGGIPLVTYHQRHIAVRSFAGVSPVLTSVRISTLPMPIASRFC